MQNNEMTALMGGEEITVMKLDGTEEKVFVRELPIKKIQSYAAVIDDEEKTSELFCDKEEGWADTLTRESFTAVISKGEELNLGFFSAWIARRLARQRMMLPELNEKILTEIARAARSASPNSA